MYELKTNNSEDVLSFYNSVNKTKSKEDYIWQKILFSENVLMNTTDLWTERYDKIHMQALQVLTLLDVDSNSGKDAVFYSNIIKHLIGLKEKIAKLDVVSARKNINNILSIYLENESVFINNFADILFEQVENASNESLQSVFEDFITTNIFCFSMYDIQFCEGRVGIETYDEQSLPNSVLIKSAFGNLVLNNVILNNAKMILDLSSTMIKNRKDKKNNGHYEKIRYQNKQEKKVEDVIKDVVVPEPEPAPQNFIPKRNSNEEKKENYPSEQRRKEDYKGSVRFNNIKDNNIPKTVTQNTSANEKVILPRVNSEDQSNNGNKTIDKLVYPQSDTRSSIPESGVNIEPVEEDVEYVYEEVEDTEDLSNLEEYEVVEEYEDDNSDNYTVEEDNLDDVEDNDSSYINDTEEDDLDNYNNVEESDDPVEENDDEDEDDFSDLYEDDDIEDEDEDEDEDDFDYESDDNDNYDYDVVESRRVKTHKLSFIPRRKSDN